MGDKNTLSERKITSESPRDHSLTDGAGSELTAAVYRGERLLLEGLLCTVVQCPGEARRISCQAAGKNELFTINQRMDNENSCKQT